jgi:diguanylate cyclase (GGDEF)-like protein
MAEERPSKELEAPRGQAGAPEVRPSKGRPPGGWNGGSPARGASSGLLARLARCLALEELETEVLEVLASIAPERKGLVALGGPASEPSRVCEPGLQPRPWRPGERVPQMVAVPVVDRHRSLGWIGVAETEPARHLDRGVRASLLELAEAAVIPALNAVRYGQALEQSMRDPLTGLLNRRALDEILAREIDAGLRYGRPVALILLDMDDFKSINDTYGHPVGDAALKRLAFTLGSEARRSDVVMRIGGDEFAILLPSSDAACARRLTERIETHLACREFSPAGCGELLRLSVSAGVADLSMLGSPTPGAMMERADRSLLASKRGRRRAPDEDPIDWNALI